jgi:hypothetical protein
MIVTHTNQTSSEFCPTVQDFYIMQPTPPKPPQAVPDSAQLSDPAQLTDSAPLAELADDLELSEVPVTTLDTSPKNYYQAIGWLRGTVIKEEERYCVQIREVNFPLYLPRRVIAVAANLEGQMAWMKCYPQSKGEGLSFKVVWMGTEQSEKSDPGIFVLRGVWQFIPQSRRPVFSIYRNELKNYENRPNNQHLPLIWSDQPPYRFRKDSEERPKFYQIMARLIPQRNCFGFVSQIAEPLDQTPKRVKKTLPGAGNPSDKTDQKPDKQGVDQPSDAPENPVATEGAETVKVASEETKPVAKKASPKVTEAKAAPVDVTAAVKAESPVEMPLESTTPETETPLVVEPAKETKATKKKAASKAVEAAPETPLSVEAETLPVAEPEEPKATKKKAASKAKSKSKP